LFHLHSPVTRKQPWRYILDESMNPYPLRSCPFPSFAVVSLTSYHWICYLFEYRAEIIILKAPYPRTQQRVRRGWELNLDYAVLHKLLHKTTSQLKDSNYILFRILFYSTVKCSAFCFLRTNFAYFFISKSVVFVDGAQEYFLSQGAGYPYLATPLCKICAVWSFF